MTITLVCNCGLLIREGSSALLVDAPNGVFAAFAAFAQDALQSLISAQPPYDALCGVCFTHTHPDHFDADALARLRAARPDVPVLLPTGSDGVWTSGAFTVQYAALAHTPVAPELETAHQVLCIACGGKLVYVTADAAPDVARHRAILAGRVADAAFWNGQYLSHAQTRALLRAGARRNFVYHLPTDAADVSGIRRKAERNMARFAEELNTVTLLPCGSTVTI